MSEKEIQIISFDVPFPPNYGGVIDVYYKIKSLAEIGVKVHLHCFVYGRSKSPELEKYCSSVYYYSRSRSVKHLFNKLPFIVASRINEQLIANLSKIKAAVFFEGLHTCGSLAHPALDNHLQIVRTHNIEHNYYRALAESERNFLRKRFFAIESGKLEKFERALSKANTIFAISPQDTKELFSRYNNVQYLPAFHANDEAFYNPNRKNFALYHGNLKVAENKETCIYLIEKVFKNNPCHLIIAGSQPDRELSERITASPNVSAIYNPDFNELRELIRNAGVNVLPAYQSAGIKLKLIEAMFNGGHILCNPEMVKNTGMEDFCRVAISDSEMRRMLNELIAQPYLKEEFLLRRSFLNRRFNNIENAKLIAEHL